MPLKPITFKIEETEADRLQEEAQDRPDKSRSAYVRDIVLNRNRPRLPKPHASPNE